MASLRTSCGYPPVKRCVLDHTGIISAVRPSSIKTSRNKVRPGQKLGVTLCRHIDNLCVPGSSRQITSSPLLRKHKFYIKNPCAFLPATFLYLFPILFFFFGRFHLCAASVCKNRGMWDRIDEVFTR